MKVKRSNLVGLLQALGYPLAGEKDDIWLVKMSDGLSDEQETDLDKHQQKLKNAIEEAIGGDEAIEIESESESESAEAETGTSPAEAKAKTKVGQKAPARKEGTTMATATKSDKKGKATAGKAASNGSTNGGKDRFGARLGSKVARVNAALSTKPQTMQELMGKAGVEDTCYGQMRKLIEAGAVVKSDKGYALKK